MTKKSKSIDSTTISVRSEESDFDEKTKKRKQEEVRRRKRSGEEDVIALSDDEYENERDKKEKKAARKSREDDSYDNGLMVQEEQEVDKYDEGDVRVKLHPSVGTELATIITTTSIVSATSTTVTKRTLVFGKVIKYLPETQDGNKNHRYFVVWNVKLPELRDGMINEEQYQSALSLFKLSATSKDVVKEGDENKNKNAEGKRNNIIKYQDSDYHGDEVAVNVTTTHRTNVEKAEDQNHTTAATTEEARIPF